MEASADSELRLPLSVCTALFDELPRAANPDAALSLIEHSRQRVLGDGLLTVNLNLGAEAAASATDEWSIVLRRLWTSNPDAYPVSGYKQKSLTPWTQRLLLDAQVFIGEGREALQSAFNDHAQIAELGLNSVVNVPLINAEGNCFATFNVLGPQTSWRPQDLWFIKLLASLSMPFVQTARNRETV
ncbi:GAF domain-containing protein [Diaphorobacter sp. NR2-3-3-1]|nr:GAF domain-containing protein [Diaphorobacter caeni]